MRYQEIDPFLIVEVEVGRKHYSPDPRSLKQGKDPCDIGAAAIMVHDGRLVAFGICPMVFSEPKSREALKEPG